MTPAAEVSEYVPRFAARCREKGWLGALFHVGVLSDITSDLRVWLRGLSRKAHQAEVYATEAQAAVRAGEAALAAGRHTEALHHFDHALALMHRGEKRDHDVTEALA
jgi:hypothetical protein